MPSLRRRTADWRRRRSLGSGAGAFSRSGAGAGIPCAGRRDCQTLLGLPIATAAELLALGNAAEVRLQPTLDGGRGAGEIGAESVALVRLIEGQRAVLTPPQSA